MGSRTKPHKAGSLKQELALDMTEKHDNILGFYSSVEHQYLETEAQAEKVDAQDEEFRSYVWGKNGVSDKVLALKHSDYGRDLELILFEFYIFPNETVIAHLKELGSYRPKEKSIGIPVVITHHNFFDKSDANRHKFLSDTILARLEALAALVKRRKLDTNMDKLLADVKDILK